MTASASSFICAAFSRLPSTRRRRSSTIASIFGIASFDMTKYSAPKQTISQKICEGKVETSNCGMAHAFLVDDHRGKIAPDRPGETGRSAEENDERDDEAEEPCRFRQGE